MPQGAPRRRSFWSSSIRHRSSSHSPQRSIVSLPQSSSDAFLHKPVAVVAMTTSSAPRQGNKLRRASAATEHSEKSGWSFGRSTKQPSLSPHNTDEFKFESSSRRNSSATSRTTSFDYTGLPSQLNVTDMAALQTAKQRIELNRAYFVLKNGKRHHAFPKELAPYPRCYDRKELDCDVWDNAFAHHLSNSVTFHSFSQPPKRVLDLGCGTGAWIMDAASLWKTTEFVGLDLVPLQPDLNRIGLSDFAARITWVHSNFLEALPFPDQHFDYVHIKRIARGVPEDRWDSLFEEVARVMKPGAAIEVIDEDLVFPGGPSSRSRPSSRTSTSSSLDPKDHTVLEDAYVSMHSARFINLNPTSLLANLLAVHFTSLKSHPPVHFSFPPLPSKTFGTGPSTVETLRMSSLGLDSGKAYVSFDPARGPALSSSPRNFTLAPRAGYLGLNQLPNSTWNFDINTLNIHLDRAVVDVLGCAESIWEHLKEVDPDADRMEFEQMCHNYERDMHEYAGLKRALEERFSWHVRSSTPSNGSCDTSDEGDVSDDEPPKLSRSLQAFCAWKAI